VARSEDIASATDAAKTSGAQAVNVLSSSLLSANRRLLIERMTALRLPAIYQWPEIADEGGFAAYGPRQTLLFRQKGGDGCQNIARGKTRRHPRRAADPI